MRHAACPSLLPRNEKAALDVDRVDKALAKDSKKRAEGSQSATRQLCNSALFLPTGQSTSSKKSRPPMRCMASQVGLHTADQRFSPQMTFQALRPRGAKRAITRP